MTELEFLVKFPSLSSLSVDGVTSDAHLTKLAPLPRLRHLRLVLNGSLDFAPSRPALESLDFSTGDETDVSWSQLLKPLHQQPRLRKLRISTGSSVAGAIRSVPKSVEWLSLLMVRNEPEEFAHLDLPLSTVDELKARPSLRCLNLEFVTDQNVREVRQRAAALGLATTVTHLSGAASIRVLEIVDEDGD